MMTTEDTTETTTTEDMTDTTTEMIDTLHHIDVPLTYITIGIENVVITATEKEKKTDHGSATGMTGSVIKTIHHETSRDLKVEKRLWNVLDRLQKSEILNYNILQRGLDQRDIEGIMTTHSTQESQIVMLFSVV